MHALTNETDMFRAAVADRGWDPVGQEQGVKAEPRTSLGVWMDVDRLAAGGWRLADGSLLG